MEEQNKNFKKVEWKGINKFAMPKISDVLLFLPGIIFAAIVWHYSGYYLLVFLIPFFIAILFARWYSKRKKINMKFVEIVVWANVITWFFPLLGIFTGTIAEEFSNLIPAQRKKYKILGNVGILLSFLNVILGILMTFYSK